MGESKSFLERTSAVLSFLAFTAVAVGLLGWILVPPHVIGFIVFISGFAVALVWLAGTLTATKDDLGATDLLYSRRSVTGHAAVTEAAAGHSSFAVLGRLPVWLVALVLPGAAIVGVRHFRN